jgi:hypothetical protein
VFSTFWLWLDTISKLAERCIFTKHVRKAYSSPSGLPFSWSETAFPRSEIGFPGAEFRFPRSENDFPSWESGFPGQGTDFPGSETEFFKGFFEFPGQEIGFPSRENGFPGWEKLVPRSKKHILASILMKLTKRALFWILLAAALAGILLAIFFPRYF